MRKSITKFLLTSLCVIMFGTSSWAAMTVVTLGTTQTIAASITANSGILTGATNVLFIIPNGYTGQAGINTDLTGLPSTVKAVTFRGASISSIMKTNQINVSSSNALDSLNLRRLTFYGVDNGVAVGSVYLFYPGSGTNVGAFTVDSCSIKNYYGAFRFANGTYRNISVNHSIIRNLGGYGFITYPLVNSSGTPATISVNNSTFYDVQASMFYLKTAQYTTVNVYNCTFDNIQGSSANFYYNNTSAGHYLNISNCIFGKVITTATGVSGTFASPYSVTNSFYTNDWSTSSAITGLSSYTAASTAMFTAPTTYNSTTLTSSTDGNYTIKDATFTGKNSSGDPRWYYNVTPGITLSSGSITGFAYNTSNSTFNTQSFTVGATLPGSAVTITAPADYEISTSASSGFGSSITLGTAWFDLPTTTIYVRLKAGLTAGAKNSENVTVSATISGSTSTQNVICSGSVGGTLTLSTASLSSLNYNPGSGPSEERSFTLTGLMLTGNVSVTPPANYEISTTSGSGFTSSPITLTTTSGLYSQTIYTRLKAGLSVATYNENIAIASLSSDFSTQYVSCSGAVLSNLTALTAPSASVTSKTGSSFTIGWTADPNAVSYTVKIYQGGSEIVAARQTDVTGTTATFTGLSAATTYTYSVTAIGDAVNYNSSPESSQASVTTFNTVKTLTAFTVTGQRGSTSYSGNNISLIVPASVNLSSVTPSVTWSGASISRTGAQDFSSGSLNYIVTAEDGSTASYTVSISVHDYYQDADASTLSTVYSNTIDGDTIRLAAGTYSTAIAFPTAKAITIKANPAAVTVPVITFQLGEPTGNNGSLTFSGVSITRGGDYFFSTTTTYTMTALKFLNCTITSINKSLINTTATGGTLSTFMMDGCKVTSSGTSQTSFLFISHTIGTLTVKNSTIYNYVGGDFGHLVTASNAATISCFPQHFY